MLYNNVYMCLNVRVSIVQYTCTCDSFCNAKQGGNAVGIRGQHKSSVSQYPVLVVQGDIMARPSADRMRP